MTDAPVGATVTEGPSAVTTHVGAGRAARQFWWWVVAAVVAGFVLRAVWVANAAHTPLGLYDPARYLSAGIQIARGKGYREPFTSQPTAYYPPGYPGFVGAVIWLSLHNPFMHNAVALIGYIQALLGAATIAAAAVIGRRVASPAAGIGAAALVALYPNLIFHTAAVLSETLCIALLLGALAVLWWHTDGRPPSRRQVVVFAVLFALGVMVRPISLPVVAVLIFLWWREAPDQRQFLRWSAVAVGVLAVVMGSWTIRNAVQMHHFVPLSTNTGDNLCIGHARGATGGFRLVPQCSNTKDSILDGPNGEVAHDREARKVGLRGLSHNLGHEPWLTWQRLYFMFQSDHDGLQGSSSYGADPWLTSGPKRTLSRIGDDCGAVILALGLVGSALLLWRGDAEGRGLVAIGVIVVGVPLLFFGDPRFKVPVTPLLAIAAAVALVAPYDLIRSRAASRARDMADAP